VGGGHQDAVQAVQDEVGGQAGIRHVELAAGDPRLDQLGDRRAGAGDRVVLAEAGLVEQHVVQLVVGQREVVGGGYQLLDPGGQGRRRAGRRGGLVGEHGGEALEVAGAQPGQQLGLGGEVEVDGALGDRGRLGDVGHGGGGRATPQQHLLGGVEDLLASDVGRLAPGRVHGQDGSTIDD
jgi:hypothetical protein